MLILLFVCYDMFLKYNLSKVVLGFLTIFGCGLFKSCAGESSVAVNDLIGQLKKTNPKNPMCIP